MASTSSTAAAAGQKICTASGAGRLKWHERWATQPAAAVAQGGRKDGQLWGSIASYASDITPVEGTFLEEVGQTAMAVDRAEHRNRNVEPEILLLETDWYARASQAGMHRVTLSIWILTRASRKAWMALPKADQR